MAGKVYAVKKGIDPNTGKPVSNLILNTWGEAEKYVKGVNGAVFKSFKKKEDATEFFTSTSTQVKKDKKSTYTNGKVYAVYDGISPKTGEAVSNILLNEWNDTLDYTKGVPNAKYESFKSLDVFCVEHDIKLFTVAFDYNIEDSEKHIDVHKCYVDGSFNEELGNYGGGLVVEFNGKVIHAQSYPGNNKEAVKMRQIGGELLGAIQACLFAKKNSASHIIIFHDYMGVQNHVTGAWKTKDEFSKIYHQWMNNFIDSNPNIRVEFEHCKAHSGNMLNEFVDGYAKIAVGLEPEELFWKLKAKLL